jgi:translation initiation factor IF-3
VPVPRRFDRRPPERDTTRINERIRVPEVRVIGEDGNQIGVMRTDEALRYAQERDLDLVEVAPEARPPVTRILDYSKYKYEQAQKQKAARKHQQQITIREIKFRPKNDYDTKKGHVMRFLKRKDKVKITIMFRGREVTHPERGQQLLERLAEELQDLAIVEQRPNLDGRNMTMMLGPSKAILSGQADADDQATSDIPAVEDDGAAGDGAAAEAGDGAAGAGTDDAAAGDTAATDDSAADAQLPTVAEAAAEAAAADADDAAAASDEPGAVAADDDDLVPESERPAAASGKRRRT